MPVLLACETSDAELDVVQHLAGHRRGLLAKKAATATVAALALVGLVAAAFAFGPGAAWGRGATEAKPATLELYQDQDPLVSVDRELQALGVKGIRERSLEDAPLYSDNPADFRAIRTQCFIDTWQAQAYLGQAVVFIYKAAASGAGLKCPDAEKTGTESGCAASVAGIITSFAWVASYLSLAASSCAESVNSKALCAADSAGMVANLGELAFAGSAVVVDCDFSEDIPEGDPEVPKLGAGILGKIKAMHNASAAPAPEPAKGGPLRKWLKKHLEEETTTPAPAPSPLEQFVERATALEEERRARIDRNYDIAQCVFDVEQSISYIIRVVLQIRSAASNCPEPKACAVDTLNIISSFAWISQFTALAVGDCAVEFYQRAFCAADVSDMVAALTNFGAAAIASTEDCADDPDPAEELELQPGDRRLEAPAAASGAM